MAGIQYRADQNGELVPLTPAQAIQLAAAQALQPAPVPDEVSRLQGRMALRAAGTPMGVQDPSLAGIFERVDAKIAASGNIFLQEAWASASTWKRQSPLIQAMAAEEDLTDAQLDSLFRSAGLFVA